MKRKILVVLVFFLWFLSSCQTTPVDEAVGYKGDDMLEQADKPSETDNTMESEFQDKPSPIPESYSLQEIFYDGDVEVLIDAKVEYPAQSAFPVFETTIEPFSNEELQRAWDTFFPSGITLFRESTNLYNRTKQEIIDMWLLPAKQTLAEIKSGKKIYDETGLLTVEDLENTIAYIEEDIAAAPETLEKEPAIMDDYTHRDEGIYAAAEMPNGEKYRFWVTNGRDMYSIYMKYESMNRNYDEWQTDPPTEMGLKISAEEAVTIAKDLLSDLEIAYMDVALVSYGSLLGGSEWEASSDKNKNTKAYAVVFTRTVDGIRSAFTVPSFQNTHNNDNYEAEFIRVHVDDKGVSAFYWYGHSPLRNEAVESIIPFDFEKVIHRSKSQLALMGAERFMTPMDNGVRKIEYRISRISLEYNRVYQKNSNQGFLYIPVWNLYGEKITTYDETYIDQQNAELGLQTPYVMVESISDIPVLSVNAVNGTVIDRIKGY